MGGFWVLAVIVLWSVVALIVGYRELHPDDSRRQKATTLALAIVMWPILLLATGLDPQQLRDAIDDDHP